MKLYTGRGDEGRTDLFGGQSTTKHAPRIEACGCVDELNATLGLAASGCTDDDLRALIHDLQARLFELGADLATPRPTGGETKDKAAIPRIADEHVKALEQRIDAIDAGLEAMRHFILPGGSELASRLHLARTVCRHAERCVVALAEQEDVGPTVIVYLNRLSDLLFAMARQANKLAGIADVPWHAPNR
ncbi:MAG: cob(I)yrinic acid a,c-diamide adenosyltransferase [Phycisphaeraceae bacterium]